MNKLPKGCLVTVAHDRKGIGKVCHLREADVEVEWFHSVASREVSVHPREQLQRVQPAEQTRCYVTDEYGTSWRMGRVIGARSVSDGTGVEYIVQFPNNRQSVSIVPEECLFVRGLGGESDPIETLIYRAQEPPFFHHHRSAFLRSLIRQRASASGLSALVSSRIVLYPHQVEIVRRVLHDPVQRYLLADEVGLGKTIEAGVIVRQVLLDDPKARALIIVPTSLTEQWRAELQGKLGLTVDGLRLWLCTANDLGQLPDEVYDILVLDEAHHIAKAARCPESYGQFKNVCSLAAASPRLLLLSATPALHHEQDFLAMLHLLDPHAYHLENVEAFRRLVESRQPIGNFLFAFREGISRPRLRRLLPGMCELFGADARILELAEHLEACCELEEFNAEEANALIRAARVYVCETYRIYRRMLRTSRSNLVEGTLARRSHDAEKAPLDLEYCDDERYPRLNEAMEEWREAAVASTVFMDEPERSRRVDQLAMIYCAFLEYAALWPTMLAWAVELRKGGIEGIDLFEERFGTENNLHLLSTSLFQGEALLLETIHSLCLTEPEDGDPIDTLVQSIHLRRERGAPRIVVFASHTPVAQEIAKRLASSLGAESILSHLCTDDSGQAEKNLLRFREGHGALTLVCDRSGEEGLNLQFADLLYHADLPWDPNRLEQRIGRLDRIGRVREVRARALIPYEGENSLYEAWCNLLRKGFRIFSESVADLQFFIEMMLPTIKRVAFLEGAPGLKQMRAKVLKGIAEERQLLAEQSALDEIEAFDCEETNVFAALQACDSDHASHQIAMEGWLLEGLRFQCQTPMEAVYDRYRFEIGASRQPIIRYEATDNTLLPYNISRALQNLQHDFGTFQRDLACSRGDLSLLRIGNAFVDALAEQLRVDDRGQVFALWRHLPSIPVGQRALFFRLDYVIQADPRCAARVLAELGWSSNRLRALLRKGDAWFPPQGRTLFVNERLRVERRPPILDVLGWPYKPADKGGQDYNLNPERRWALDEVIAPEHWANLCEQVRSCAEAAIRQDTAFQQYCEARVTTAMQELAVRSERLRQGQAFRHGTLAPAELTEEEQIYHALLEGIQKPQVKLDAVGVLVLSGWNPFA